MALLNEKTGQRALYALPMGRTTNHVHVWKSLLEQAGFTLADIPKQWDAVLVLLVRPGAAGRAPGHGPRRHLGRRPQHVGRRPSETQFQFLQFLAAYEADYVTRDGRLVHRRAAGPAEAHRRPSTATPPIYRKGCTPPSST